MKQWIHSPSKARHINNLTGGNMMPIHIPVINKSETVVITVRIK